MLSLPHTASDLEEEFNRDAVGPHAAVCAVQFDARFQRRARLEQRIDPLGQVAHNRHMFHEANGPGLDTF